MEIPPLTFAKVGHMYYVLFRGVTEKLEDRYMDDQHSITVTLDGLTIKAY